MAAKPTCRLRALERLLRPTPASGEALTAMTRMWEEAGANHPGPSVLESVLLPAPPSECYDLPSLGVSTGIDSVYGQSL